MRAASDGGSCHIGGDCEDECASDSEDAWDCGGVWDFENASSIAIKHITFIKSSSWKPESTIAKSISDRTLAMVDLIQLFQGEALKHLPKSAH